MIENHDATGSATANTGLWVEEVQTATQNQPETTPSANIGSGNGNATLEIHISNPDHTPTSITFQEGLFLKRPSAPPSEAVSMLEVGHIGLEHPSSAENARPNRAALASELLGRLNGIERPKSKDHDVRSARMSRDTGSIRSAPGFTKLPATVPNHAEVDEHRIRRYWRMSRRLHLRKHPPPLRQSALSSSSSWLSVDAERAKQREKILKGVNINEKLSSEQYSEAILRLAVDYKTQRHFEFNRFEHLSLIRILDCQHQLVAFDESFHYGESRVMDDVKRRKLNDAFTNYISAIEAFEKLSKYNQPGFARSKKTNQTLALKLHEPRYWDSPDALNVFELAAPERSPCTDRIRLWLQRHIFEPFLDQQGKEQRGLERERDRKIKQRKDASRHTGIIAEDSRIILDGIAHNRYHVSPVVDNLARFLVALAGGVLLLVPMVVLVFCNHSLTGTLSSEVGFVFLFAVLISWGSAALNQEVLLATAAYGAILVAFVANISDSIHT